MIGHLGADVVLVNNHVPGTLFVYFTSYQLDWKSNSDKLRFDFLNTALRESQAALCLRDRQNLWYHNGIDGASGDIAAVVDLILSYARGRPGIICVGSSMGGYAALLFGHLVRAKLVVAIVPQIRLGSLMARELGETRFDERFVELERVTQTPEYLSLDRVLTAQTSMTRFVAICGREGWIDVQHIRLIEGIDNIEVVYFAGASHNEAALMCLKADFLRQFFDGSYLRTGRLTRSETNGAD